MSNLLTALAEIEGMSRAELDSYLAEQETPLIDELAELESPDLAMSAEERRARKLVIRDQRLAIERVRDTWLRLHRDPQSGPDQTI